jgi:hypothetical protein
MNMQIAKLISILPYIMVPLILCVACTSDKGGGPPDGPGYPEMSIVWVDTVPTIAGNHVKVDVYAGVATRSLGVRLPLKLSSTGLNIDSVSFRATMLAQEPIAGSVVIDSSAKSVRIVREYLESDIIEPDSGVLVSLFIALDDTLTAQTIEVDTTIGGFSFTDDRGLQSVPEFTPGLIHVSEKSSVWVDTVDVVAGDQAQVDVHAVLRSPIQGIGLPLRLLVANFAVDSVSFVGTMLVEDSPLLDLLNIDDSHAGAVLIDMLRTYRPADFIEPDSGLLMSIYVATPVSAEAQTIEIDTTTIEGNSFLIVDTSFVSVGSVPFFTPGLINVAPTPSGASIR